MFQSSSYVERSGWKVKLIHFDRRQFFFVVGIGYGANRGFEAGITVAAVCQFFKHVMKNTAYETKKILEHDRFSPNSVIRQ
jgi:hypothetical protein